MTMSHEIPTSPASNTQLINSCVTVWTPEECGLKFFLEEFASRMPVALSDCTGLFWEKIVGKSGAEPMPIVMYDGRSRRGWIRCDP